MIKEFDTIDEFLRFWDTRFAAVERAKKAALEKGAQMVVKAAQAKIGHYQEAVGPFVAWAPLSPNTLNGGVSPSGFHYQGKIELGFAPPDNPLLRDGALRDAYTSSVNGNEFAVGVRHQEIDHSYGAPVDIGLVAFWMEFGTRYMPPRPVVGPALYETAHEVVTLVAGSMLAAMVGQRKPLRPRGGSLP